jgi:transcriptional regulator with XRE-family HTH domain
MQVHVHRSLAQFICDEMDRQGIATVAGLAEAVGVTPATARRLMEGQGTPREETLTKIAEAFDVSVSTVREMVEPTSLAAYLNAQMSDPELSSTKKLGNFIGISQGTAWRLTKGLNIPKDETLHKIADAFHLDVTMVREMAHRPMGERESFGWPPEFDQLTLPERETLFEVGRRFIEAHGLGRVTR